MKLGKTAILVMGLIMSASIDALDLVDIEKLAAKEAGCSIIMPCQVTVNEADGKFIVQVKRSSFISPEGVLKFRTGSIVYYTYSSIGLLINTKKTT